MTLPITIATLTILMLSKGVLVLVRRLGSDNQFLPVTTEWLNELSPLRYHPMLRLLEESDFQFLRSQKGFTPEMASRLRRQRAHAFRGYLHLLHTDFNRISAALRMILAQSSCDRPDLSSLVFRYQMMFVAGLMRVHFRLVLFRFGFSGADVSNLIHLFDGIRLELRTLAPNATPALA